MKRTIVAYAFSFALVSTFLLSGFHLNALSPDKMKQKALRVIDPPTVYYQQVGMLSISWNPTGEFPAPYTVEVYAEPKHASSFYSGPQVTWDAYMTRYYTLPLDQYITVFITAGPYHVTTSTTFYNESPGGSLHVPLVPTKK